MKPAIPTALLLCAAVRLTAQTADAPARAVIDPGIITTRQAITPAGVQAIFNGRVYGVTFGGEANEICVPHGRAVTRLDWRSNRVLSQTAIRGRMGLQGICYDARTAGALAAHADAKGKVQLLALTAEAAKTAGRDIG